MDPMKEEKYIIEVAVNAEVNTPIEPECGNVIAPPAFFEPTSIEQPESSAHANFNRSNSDDLKRCKTSWADSSCFYSNTCSRSDKRPMVEESSFRNYRFSNSATVTHSNITQGISHRQSDNWQCFYQQSWVGPNSRTGDGDLMPQDKELVSWSPVEVLKRKSLGLQKSKSRLRKENDTQPSKTSYQLADDHDKTVSVKEKGEVFSSEIPQAHANYCAITVGQNENGRVSDAFLNPSPISILSNSSYNDGKELKLPHHGISLRELLKHGVYRISKLKRLHLFRQIVQIVDGLHSQGIALLDLRPSFFILLPPENVKYVGSSTPLRVLCKLNQDTKKRRQSDKEVYAHGGFYLKQQKIDESMRKTDHRTQFTHPIESVVMGMQNCDSAFENQKFCSNEGMYTQAQCQIPSEISQECSSLLDAQLEKEWYACHTELEHSSLLSSNIYSLGILLFELLYHFESIEAHLSAMCNLHLRVLPSSFLSDSPKEAGFCFWLLHPEPASRPTTREILQSDLIDQSEETSQGDDVSSDLLVNFLASLKEEKQNQVSKLLRNLEFLEADIMKVKNMHPFARSWAKVDRELYDSRQELHAKVSSNAKNPYNSPTRANMLRPNFLYNIGKLEDAYFCVKSEIQVREISSIARPDKDVLRDKERWSLVQTPEKDASTLEESKDNIGDFFYGICKFARYSKFEVCGTLRSGDILNSNNVICSLSFDRGGEYIAAAGVSKKIKVFEFDSILNDSAEVQYLVIELLNESKLSCVCWNNYIKKYLASSDYGGVVQIWDASIGQGFARYTEHQKRAWSVHFSQKDPKMFASGSDDCSVKLWSINDGSSSGTIWNPANICCVQFSAFSSHLLAFGSADYKIYCYDLRHTKIPWCTLAGHAKPVSDVKLLDSETLVSASTDNTLKLWDLKRTSLEGLSLNACSLTFTGHNNEKNFVGLSVSDGYIVCGSETNEVYSYYKSFPMPIASYKFGCIDTVSGHESSESNGHFVSSVCWRRESNLVVAANSSGNIKLLRLV